MLRALAFGGAALAVGALTSAGPGREADLEAFEAGNRDRGPNADRFFLGVTELGSIWASAGAAAVLAAAGRRRAAGRGLPPPPGARGAGPALQPPFLPPRPPRAGPPGATPPPRRPARPSGPQ